MNTVVGAAAQTCRTGWKNGNCEDSFCQQTLYEWWATSKQVTRAISCTYLSTFAGQNGRISQNSDQKCLVILPFNSLHFTDSAAGRADTTGVVNMVTLCSHHVDTSVAVSCIGWEWLDGQNWFWYEIWGSHSDHQEDNCSIWRQRKFLWNFDMYIRDCASRRRHAYLHDFRYLNIYINEFFMGSYMFKLY